MAFSVRNDTNTAHITSTSDHDDVAGIKLDKAGDLALVDVELDCVVDPDGGVGVADRAPVMGHNVRHAASADGHLFYLAELVGRLFGCDAVDCEAALDIVQQTEEFTRPFDPDDVCTAGLRDTSSRAGRGGPWKPMG